MKLTAFRVEMYKSVIDSQWIQVSSLTTLVGKNEAGKTSLLKALHKLNPFRKENYSISNEWPRAQRQKRNVNHRVCRAKFDLEPDDLAGLVGASTAPFPSSSLEIWRTYAGDLGFEFPQNHFSKIVDASEVRSRVEVEDFFAWPECGAQASDEFQALVLEIEPELQGLLEKDGDSETFRKRAIEVLDELKELVSDRPLVAVPETAYIDALAEENSSILEAIDKLPTPYEKAVEFITARIPTFIYMDDYRAFSGTARLDEVSKRKREGRPTQEDRSLMTILELSGLDLDLEVKRAALTGAEDAEQRQFDLDDASTKLTLEIEGRWKQKKYEVEFRADGQQFITFVKDSADPSLIKLEERSKGFQWFFSFDLLFMYESKGEFKNCVILLDEPGLHLHPDAQKDLLARLEHFAENNILVYSTHLPFMIDLRHPSRIRVVSESPTGTIVTEDLIGAQPEGRLTIQAALGMSGSSSYLLANRNLVVEGVDDFWLISELSSLLIRSGESGLDEDIFITAAGGASEATYIATLMVGQKLEVAVLFDTDKAGSFEKDRLIKSWLALYNTSKMKLLDLAAAVGSDNSEFSVEDLFTDDFYLESVKEAYKKDIATHAIKLALKGKDQLCKRVERCFLNAEITYNKGRVAKLLRRRLSQMKHIDDLPEPTRVKARSLIKAISESLK